MAIEAVGKQPAQESVRDPAQSVRNADFTTQAFRAGALSSRRRSVLPGEQNVLRTSTLAPRPYGSPTSPAESGPITGWQYRGRRLDVLNPEGPDGADRDNRIYLSGDHTRVFRRSYLAPEPLSGGPETVIPHVIRTPDGGWELCRPGDRPGPRYIGTGRFIRPMRGES
jgi:hypothetical protein